MEFKVRTNKDVKHTVYYIFILRVTLYSNYVANLSIFFNSLIKNRDSHINFFAP